MGKMQKVILIGNYSLDRQESMERFAIMLKDGFNKYGIVAEIRRPVMFFGKKGLNPYSGLGKYLGYIDKWIVFPILLLFRALKSNKNVCFHICDHSNAPYLKYLPKERSGITCHDVLAIRGAFGHEDAFCPSSGMGIVLQKWILKNLKKANNLVSVSQFTLNQLKELCEGENINSDNWRIVHNAFNAPFRQLSKEECASNLKGVLDVNEPFILHVGSSLPRKNRTLLLDMVKCLGENWKGKICYAGGTLDNELIKHAENLDISDRIISIPGPDHNTLVALFSLCEAFIFPSLSEGFGWPLIEAQACGAPVIASDLQPMPEVSGGSALHVSPYKPALFAEAFLDLQNDDYRKDIVKRGFDNIKRFSNNKMIAGYIQLYS